MPNYSKSLHSLGHGLLFHFSIDLSVPMKFWITGDFPVWRVFQNPSWPPRLYNKKTNYTYLYACQIIKEIADHILRCHAKFHKNSCLIKRVMGLWKLTKLLPFCTLTKIFPKYIPNNKVFLHMHWLSYMWIFNVFGW